MRTNYYTQGELLLDKGDSYVVELFSYDNYLQQPPLREHLREVFETREQALDYVRQLHEGAGIIRQITLYDMTAERPHITAAVERQR